MAEEMISLDKFLEELVTTVKERLEEQERRIFALQKKINILEKVLRDKDTGRVKKSTLNKLKERGK